MFDRDICCLIFRFVVGVVVACGSMFGLAASPDAGAEPKTFYVATNGNNNWSGMLSEPNAEKTDGPFATLEHARDEIRKLKKENGLPAGGVVVELRGGIYELTETLELLAEDSGTVEAPIVYQARPGEEVRLVGGKVVTDWKPVIDPKVLKRLDKSAHGKVLQADLKSLGITDYGQVDNGGIELFFQDKPMTMARGPNEGFIKIADLVGGSPNDLGGVVGDKIGKFVYKGNLPKRWVDEPDAWVHGFWFWDWAEQRHKIESIDSEKRILAVVPPYHAFGYRKEQWFYGFNILAELDKPGEWYLDRQTGVLYFWPPKPIESGRPMVSTAKTHVTMQNVSYVTLRGLTIEVARGTAVVMRYGDQNTIANCTLRNVGSWAIFIESGTAHSVVGCDIYHTGDGGVSMYAGDRETLKPAGHCIDNNHIHHYSRWNRIQRPAIVLFGVGNRASHNRIHDAPHEAISFGGNENCIELNEIYNVCYEVNDGGAIYSGRDWTQRGNIIRHNFIHHLYGFEKRGCQGIYLDDMFSGTTISGNVFYDVTNAAFIGGGRDNVVVNNIFVDCKPAVHVDSRGLGWAAFCANGEMKEALAAMPYQTSPWRERYPELIAILDDQPAAPKGNQILRNVCVGGTWSDVDAGAEPFVKFQDNLVGENPGFVNRAAMNFQLRPNSPVYKKIPSFQNIPFDQIGLKKDEYRIAVPAR